MKKMIVTLGLMLAFTLAVTAQPQMRGGKHFSREERAQKCTDRMVADYKLNKKQAAKLLELNTWYVRQFPEARPDGPRRGPQLKHGQPQADAQTGATPKAEPQNREGAKPDTAQHHAKQPHAVRMSPIKEKRIAEEYNNRLQKILTKKQYKKYLSEEPKRNHRR